MKRLILALLMVTVTGLGGQLLYADDTELFMIQVAPDVLITLDLSGSMGLPPQGETLYIADAETCGNDVPYYGSPGPGRSKNCNTRSSGWPKWSGSACTDPYYKTSRAGSTTDCSRLAIAKRVIRDVLDHNNSGSINSQDEALLNVRFGYMRFWNCGSDTGADYNSGCNTKIKDFNTAYNQINTAVQGETNSGGTALAYSLMEAKKYIEDSKSGDTAAACRKKFVILITDGEDTLACGGTGTINQPGDYKRRRETVAKAKALADAGYNVFVVGFGGDMPHFLKNTLNWAAKFGGTDNPKISNTGNLQGYNPSLVTSCQDSDELQHDIDGDGLHYYANSNDPGEAGLSGYAFLAQDAVELANSLTTILKYIQEKAYSFTAPTIPLVRIMDQEMGYVSSFIPNDTRFWRGNLKAYTLNPDGTFPVDADGNPLNANLVWDAIEKLNQVSPSARRIYTYKNNSLTEFTYNNITNADLDVSSDTDRANLIKHIRGIDAFNANNSETWTGNEERLWKLGDIFHSNGVVVGAPNKYFEAEGYSGPGGFYETQKNRTKVIIVGSNDGMLHAFNAATGVEVWAFIPPSVLKTLKLMLPGNPHAYYVDSSPKVSDVWIHSSMTDTTKSESEWRTILVCGLRKGGKQYFALDITDTLNPVFLWEFPLSNDSATLAKVGQSWSEPAIGKVKIEHNPGTGNQLYERWVAFIGGGFDPSETKSNKATIGRAFFVIDLKTGNAIWEYSSDPSTTYDNTDQRKYMTYALVAPPTMTDLNADGYVDRVYIGDMAGQMWAFDVVFDPINKVSETLWSAKRLTEPPASNSEKHPVFYQAAVAFDEYRKPWVYFGTGDRENPTDTTNPAEYFYAVKDDGVGVYPGGRIKNCRKSAQSIPSSSTRLKRGGIISWSIRPNWWRKCWQGRWFLIISSILPLMPIKAMPRAAPSRETLGSIF
ncbi:MAG: VWA domain-containing protein [Deltaproteobacteria bacterium]|nr:VWA domain-containing protein [Deltaproteobacteria bacterium]